MKLPYLLAASLFALTSCSDIVVVTLEPVEDRGQEYIYPEPGDYSGAAVTVEYLDVDSNFEATLQAEGMKPWFTYQMKLVGVPSCLGGDDATNEKIGYSGRWYCVDCDGSPAGNNRSDAQYEANKALPEDDPDKECIMGYLVFDYFVTDQDGKVSIDVQADASYHVLWCGPAPGSNAYLYSGYTPPGAYCTDGKYCTYLDIAPEVERPTFSRLPEGQYSNVKIELTEESFHQNCGTWCTVLWGRLSFKINR